MDAKEIKNNLKLAKEAIKSKDYKVTLRHCKDVLKLDKDNYTALVFIGIAAQELDQHDQAVLAFRRAINNSPEQVLAWQGLCTFYEKTNQEKDVALIEIYEKLMKFYENDVEKYFNIVVKYISVLIEAKKFLEAVDTVQKAQVTYLNENDKYYTLTKLFVNLIFQNDQLKTQYSDLLLNAFDVLIDPDEKVSNENLEQHYTKYVEYLIDIFHLTSAEEIATKMQSKFPNNIFATISLCRIYVYQFCVNNVKPPPNITSLLKTVMEKDEFSDIYTLTRMMIAFNSQQYNSVIGYYNGEIHTPDNIQEYYFFISLSYNKLHQYESSNVFAGKALKFYNGETVVSAMFVRRLNIIISKNAYHLGNFELMTERFNFLSTLDDKDEEILILMLRISLKLSQPEQRIKTIHSELQIKFPESVELLNVEAQIKLSEHNIEEAEAKLQLMVSSNKVDDETFSMLGHLNWKKEKWKESFNFFLQAAKLNPYQSEYFLYIGHYYNNQLNDKKRAGKCYQKAFYLDPTSEEAGCAYSNILSVLGDKEENYQLLTKVTKNAKMGSMKWAFNRLGVYHLENNDSAAAVKVFQNALHADTEDFLCWELLAEAYKSRGSYNAAMKAYTKAFELNEESIYCRYQVAVLKKKLGLYSEALEHFRFVLDKKPDYVPAAKDFVSTLLLLAKSHLENSFNKSCISCCQEAISVLSSILSVRSNNICLWKLSGDTCSILAPISADIISLSIPAGIFSKLFQSTGSKYIANKSEILNLGSRCFGQALTLSSENASLWHDLGLNYLYQAEECNDLALRENLYQRSVISLKKAVMIFPKSQTMWNSLGVVATKSGAINHAIAQHAFIQSIKLENSNVIAWTNLGLLYLSVGNIELAHKALKIAQAAEPSYGNCWIAQAIIAETIQHEETMDLFRHSTELTKHNEAAIGYASNVCQALKEMKDHSSHRYKYAIETLSAVTASSDALTNYTDCKTNSAEAYNILGMLLERQKLYTSAVSFYQKALELVKNQEEKLTGICLNLARCLCFSNQPSDAVLMYENVKTNSYLQCVYKADAYYMNNDLKEAVLEYKNGMKIAASDREKGLLEVALAMCAYKMADLTQAKNLLLECSHKNPNLVESHFALCALGILQSDKMLSQAALQELLPFQNDSVYMKDIALFKCYVSVLQGKKDNARKVICEFIHKDPKNTKLWLLLASTILQLSPEDSSIAARCAVVAEKLGDTSEKITDVEYTKYTSIFANLCNFYQIQNNENVDQTLQVLIELVFENSSVLFGWMVLLKVFHMLGKTKEMELVLKQWIQRSNQKTNISPKEKIIPLLLMTFLTRKASLASGEDPFFNSVMKETLKVDPDCGVAHFLQAIFLHEDKKSNLTNKRFCSVLRSPGCDAKNVELLAAKLLCESPKKNYDYILKVLIKYIQVTKSYEVEKLREALAQSEK
ncbi:Tetratricopeptide repeat protein 37 [Nymphon striatum]|nr:Tetratricopeptide repeat protein 37 [Nymphon striatum]